MVLVCVTGLEEGKDTEKNKELSERARVLRKSTTKEEQKLWKLYLFRCQFHFHSVCVEIDRTIKENMEAEQV